MLKNSAANLVRGAAAALVALLLPPFLTSYMSKDAFAAWSLVLQVSAYVGYLDFGVQTAVGRFVAHANERGDSAQRDRIVSTAFVWLSTVAVVASVLALIGAAFIERIFPQMPLAYVHESRIALALVGVSLAFVLPSTTFSGVFVGRHRNEFPALIIGGSRLVTAVLLIVLVRNGYSLIPMAAVTAGINILAAVLQWLIAWRMFPEVRLSRGLVDRRSSRELYEYCRTLTIWNFAMFLVAGLDLTIVGIFRYSEVPYYSVASSLVLFLAGMQNAIFNAMIPSAAVMHARGDASALGRMLIISSRYGMFLLLLTGLPLIFFSQRILSLWVGADYAIPAARILEVLVLAGIIRLSATPYMVTLMGTGEHRLITLSPLLEGFSNLTVSLVLGYFFGAIGVALGTLFGAIVGMSSNLLYNMHRTKQADFGVGRYVREGIFRPLFCFSPLFVSAMASRTLFSAETGQRLIIWVVGAMLAALFTFKWGSLLRFSRIGDD